jgi:Kef-type K+ transport system membrane component KefB
MSKLEALLLLCICIGAFLMPFISRKFSLPSAVGEILFGLGVGLLFKDAFHQTSIITFLGELGFILLMYLAGLEINFEKIKITPKKDLLLYFSMVISVVILSIGSAYILNQPPIFILVYLTTAVGLLFPVLKETGTIESDMGQTLLIIGSIGEVVSLIALTVFILYYRFGLSIESAIHLGQIAAFVIGAYLIHKVFTLIIWWFPGLVRPFLNTNDASESGIRANFANMFTFVALAALMDIELIIGAFLGGMAFGLVFKKREHIQERIGGFAYGFLIPVFFIEVGLRFDVKKFLNLEVLVLALAITIIIFSVRFIAALVLLFSGLSITKIFLVPIATSFPLTLLVAIASFGLENKIILEKQAASILLAAILTSFIYPAIMKKIINKKLLPHGS